MDNLRKHHDLSDHKSTFTPRFLNQHQTQNQVPTHIPQNYHQPPQPLSQPPISIRNVAEHKLLDLCPLSIIAQLVKGVCQVKKKKDENLITQKVNLIRHGLATLLNKSHDRINRAIITFKTNPNNASILKSPFFAKCPIHSQLNQLYIANLTTFWLCMFPEHHGLLFQLKKNLSTILNNELKLAPKNEIKFIVGGQLDAQLRAKLPDEYINPPQISAFGMIDPCLYHMGYFIRKLEAAGSLEERKIIFKHILHGCELEFDIPCCLVNETYFEDYHQYLLDLQQYREVKKQAEEQRTLHLQMQLEQHHLQQTHVNPGGLPDDLFDENPQQAHQKLQKSRFVQQSVVAMPIQKEPQPPQPFQFFRKERQRIRKFHADEIIMFVYIILATAYSDFKLSIDLFLKNVFRSLIRPNLHSSLAIQWKSHASKDIGFYLQTFLIHHQDKALVHFVENSICSEAISLEHDIEPMCAKKLHTSVITDNEFDNLLPTSKDHYIVQDKYDGQRLIVYLLPNDGTPLSGSNLPKRMSKNPNNLVINDLELPKFRLSSRQHTNYTLNFFDHFRDYILSSFRGLKNVILDGEIVAYNLETKCYYEVYQLRTIGGSPTTLQNLEQLRELQRDIALDPTPKPPVQPPKLTPHANKPTPQLPPPLPSTQQQKQKQPPPQQRIQRNYLDESYESEFSDSDEDREDSDHNMSQHNSNQDGDDDGPLDDDGSKKMDSHDSRINKSFDQVIGETIDEDPNSISQIVSLVMRDNSKDVLVYRLFDILYYEGASLLALPYYQRRHILLTLFANREAPPFFTICTDTLFVPDKSFAKQHLLKNSTPFYTNVVPSVKHWSQIFHLALNKQFQPEHVELRQDELKRHFLDQTDYQNWCAKYPAHSGHDCGHCYGVCELCQTVPTNQRTSLLNSITNTHAIDNSSITSFIKLLPRDQYFDQRKDLTTPFCGLPLRKEFLQQRLNCALQRGLEGLVLKTLTGAYLPSHRDVWHKIKPYEEVDLIIFGCDTTTRYAKDGEYGKFLVGSFDLGCSIQAHYCKYLASNMNLVNSRQAISFETMYADLWKNPTKIDEDCIRLRYVGSISGGFDAVSCTKITQWIKSKFLTVETYDVELLEIWSRNKSSLNERHRKMVDSGRAPARQLPYLTSGSKAGYRYIFKNPIQDPLIVQVRVSSWVLRRSSGVNVRIPQEWAKAREKMFRIQSSPQSQADPKIAQMTQDLTMYRPPQLLSSAVPMHGDTVPDLPNGRFQYVQFPLAHRSSPIRYCEAGLREPRFEAWRKDKSIYQIETSESLIDRYILQRSRTNGLEYQKAKLQQFNDSAQNSSSTAIHTTTMVSTTTTNATNRGPMKKNVQELDINVANVRTLAFNNSTELLARFGNLDPIRVTQIESAYMSLYNRVANKLKSKIIALPNQLNGSSALTTQRAIQFRHQAALSAAQQLAQQQQQEQQQQRQQQQQQQQSSHNIFQINAPRNERFQVNFAQAQDQHRASHFQAQQELAAQQNFIQYNQQLIQLDREERLKNVNTNKNRLQQQQIEGEFGSFGFDLDTEYQPKLPLQEEILPIFDDSYDFNAIIDENVIIDRADPMNSSNPSKMGDQTDSDDITEDEKDRLQPQQLLSTSKETSLIFPTSFQSLPPVASFISPPLDKSKDIEASTGNDNILPSFAVNNFAHQSSDLNISNDIQEVTFPKNDFYNTNDSSSLTHPFGDNSIFENIQDDNEQEDFFTNHDTTPDSDILQRFPTTSTMAAFRQRAEHMNSQSTTISRINFVVTDSAQAEFEELLNGASTMKSVHESLGIYSDDDEPTEDDEVYGVLPQNENVSKFDGKAVNNKTKTNQLDDLFDENDHDVDNFEHDSDLQNDNVDVKSDDEAGDDDRAMAQVLFRHMKRNVNADNDKFGQIGGYNPHLVNEYGKALQSQLFDVGLGEDLDDILASNSDDDFDSHNKQHSISNANISTDSLSLDNQLVFKATQSTMPKNISPKVDLTELFASLSTCLQDDDGDFDDTHNSFKAATSTPPLFNHDSSGEEDLFDPSYVSNKSGIKTGLLARAFPTSNTSTHPPSTTFREITSKTSSKFITKTELSNKKQKTTTSTQPLEPYKPLVTHHVRLPSGFIKTDLNSKYDIENGSDNDDQQLVQLPAPTLIIPTQKPRKTAPKPSPFSTGPINSTNFLLTTFDTSQVTGEEPFNMMQFMKSVYSEYGHDFDPTPFASNSLDSTLTTPQIVNDSLKIPKVNKKVIKSVKSTTNHVIRPTPTSIRKSQQSSWKSVLPEAYTPNPHLSLSSSTSSTPTNMTATSTSIPSLSNSLTSSSQVPPRNPQLPHLVTQSIRELNAHSQITYITQNLQSQVSVTSLGQFQIKAVDQIRFQTSNIFSNISFYIPGNCPPQTVYLPTGVEIHAQQQSTWAGPGNAGINPFDIRKRFPQDNSPVTSGLLQFLINSKVNGKLLNKQEHSAVETTKVASRTNQKKEKISQFDQLNRVPVEHLQLNSKKFDVKHEILHVNSLFASVQPISLSSSDSLSTSFSTSQLKISSSLATGLQTDLTPAQLATLPSLHPTKTAIQKSTQANSTQTLGVNSLAFQLSATRSTLGPKSTIAQNLSQMNHPSQRILTENDRQIRDLQFNTSRDLNAFLFPISSSLFLSHYKAKLSIHNFSTKSKRKSYVWGTKLLLYTLSQIKIELRCHFDLCIQKQVQLHEDLESHLATKALLYSQSIVKSSLGSTTTTSLANSYINQSLVIDNDDQNVLSLDDDDTSDSINSDTNHPPSTPQKQPKGQTTLPHSDNLFQQDQNIDFDQYSHNARGIVNPNGSIFSRAPFPSPSSSKGPSRFPQSPSTRGNFRIPRTPNKQHPPRPLPPPVQSNAGYSTLIPHQLTRDNILSLVEQCGGHCITDIKQMTLNHVKSNRKARDYVNFYLQLRGFPIWKERSVLYPNPPHVPDSNTSIALTNLPFPLPNSTNEPIINDHSTQQSIQSTLENNNAPHNNLLVIITDNIYSVQDVIRFHPAWFTQKQHSTSHLFPHSILTHDIIVVRPQWLIESIIRGSTTIPLCDQINLFSSFFYQRYNALNKLFIHPTYILYSSFPTHTDDLTSSISSPSAMQSVKPPANNSFSSKPATTMNDSITSNLSTTTASSTALLFEKPTSTSSTIVSTPQIMSQSIYSNPYAIITPNIHYDIPQTNSSMSFNLTEFTSTIPKSIFPPTTKPFSFLIPPLPAALSTDLLLLTPAKTFHYLLNPMLNRFHDSKATTDSNSTRKRLAQHQPATILATNPLAVYQSMSRQHQHSYVNDPLYFKQTPNLTFYQINELQQHSLFMLQSNFTTNLNIFQLQYAFAPNFPKFASNSEYGYIEPMLQQYYQLETKHLVSILNSKPKSSTKKHILPTNHRVHFHNALLSTNNLLTTVAAPTTTHHYPYKYKKQENITESRFVFIRGDDFKVANHVIDFHSLYCNQQLIREQREDQRISIINSSFGMVRQDNSAFSSNKTNMITGTDRFRYVDISKVLHKNFLPKQIHFFFFDPLYFSSSNHNLPQTIASNPTPQPLLTASLRKPRTDPQFTSSSSTLPNHTTSLHAQLPLPQRYLIHLNYTTYNPILAITPHINTFISSISSYTDSMSSLQLYLSLYLFGNRDSSDSHPSSHPPSHPSSHPTSHLPSQTQSQTNMLQFTSDYYPTFYFFSQLKSITTHLSYLRYFLSTQLSSSALYVYFQQQRHLEICPWVQTNRSQSSSSASQSTTPFNIIPLHEHDAISFPIYTSQILYKLREQLTKLKHYRTALLERLKIELDLTEPILLSQDITQDEVHEQISLATTHPFLILGDHQGGAFVPSSLTANSIEQDQYDSTLSIPISGFTIQIGGDSTQSPLQTVSSTALPPNVKPISYRPTVQPAASSVQHKRIDPRDSPRQVIDYSNCSIDAQGVLVLDRVINVIEHLFGHFMLLCEAIQYTLSSTFSTMSASKSPFSHLKTAQSLEQDISANQLNIPTQAKISLPASNFDPHYGQCPCVQYAQLSYLTYIILLIIDIVSNNTVTHFQHTLKLTSASSTIFSASFATAQVSHLYPLSTHFSTPYETTADHIGASQRQPYNTKNNATTPEFPFSSALDPDSPTNSAPFEHIRAQSIHNNSNITPYQAAQPLDPKISVTSSPSPPGIYQVSLMDIQFPLYKLQQFFLYRFTQSLPYTSSTLGFGNSTMNFPPHLIPSHHVHFPYAFFNITQVSSSLHQLFFFRQPLHHEYFAPPKSAHIPYFSPNVILDGPISLFFSFSIPLSTIQPFLLPTSIYITNRGDQKSNETDKIMSQTAPLTTNKHKKSSTIPIFSSLPFISDLSSSPTNTLHWLNSLLFYYMFTKVVFVDPYAQQLQFSSLYPPQHQSSTQPIPSQSVSSIKLYPASPQYGTYTNIVPIYSRTAISALQTPHLVSVPKNTSSFLPHPVIVHQENENGTLVTKQSKLTQEYHFSPYFTSTITPKQSLAVFSHLRQFLEFIYIEHYYLASSSYKNQKPQTIKSTQQEQSQPPSELSLQFFSNLPQIIFDPSHFLSETYDELEDTLSDTFTADNEHFSSTSSHTQPSSTTISTNFEHTHPLTSSSKLLTSLHKMGTNIANVNIAVPISSIDLQDYAPNPIIQAPMMTYFPYPILKKYQVKLSLLRERIKTSIQPAKYLPIPAHSRIALYFREKNDQNIVKARGVELCNYLYDNEFTPTLQHIAQSATQNESQIGLLLAAQESNIHYVPSQCFTTSPTLYSAPNFFPLQQLYVELSYALYAANDFLHAQLSSGTDSIELAQRLKRSQREAELKRQSPGHRLSFASMHAATQLNSSVQSTLEFSQAMGMEHLSKSTFLSHLDDIDAVEGISDFDISGLKALDNPDIDHQEYASNEQIAQLEQRQRERQTMRQLWFSHVQLIQLRKLYTLRPLTKSMLQYQYAIQTSVTTGIENTDLVNFIYLCYRYILNQFQTKLPFNNVIIPTELRSSYTLNEQHKLQLQAQYQRYLKEIVLRNQPFYDVPYFSSIGHPPSPIWEEYQFFYYSVTAAKRAKLRLPIRSPQLFSSFSSPSSRFGQPDQVMDLTMDDDLTPTPQSTYQHPFYQQSTSINTPSTQVQLSTPTLSQCSCALCYIYYTLLHYNTTFVCHQYSAQEDEALLHRHLFMVQTAIFKQISTFLKYSGPNIVRAIRDGYKLSFLWYYYIINNGPSSSPFSSLLPPLHPLFPSSANQSSQFSPAILWKTISANTQQLLDARWTKLSQEHCKQLQFNIQSILYPQPPPHSIDQTHNRNLKNAQDFYDAQSKGERLFSIFHRNHETSNEQQRSINLSNRLTGSIGLHETLTRSGTTQLQQIKDPSR